MSNHINRVINNQRNKYNLYKNAQLQFEQQQESSLAVTKPCTQVPLELTSSHIMYNIINDTGKISIVISVSKRKILVEEMSKSPSCQKNERNFC